jgi:hypothetical protein
LNVVQSRPFTAWLATDGLMVIVARRDGRNEPATGRLALVIR